MTPKFKPGDRVQLIGVKNAIVIGTVVNDEYDSIGEIDEIAVKWDHLLNLYDDTWKHSKPSTDRLRLVSKLDRILG